MKPNLLVDSIIFDLDGTLIDTAPDVRLALNHMLSMYQKRSIDAEEIHELIGQGATVMLKKAFKKSNYILHDDEIYPALNCYLTYYKAHPVIETKIYPGVLEILNQLKRAEIKLGICTNKPAVMTHIVLEKLNLAHYFQAIVAGDEVKDQKPHANHVLEVMRQMNTTHLTTVMVGDSEVDKMGAKNANIPFIGVSYGYELDQSTKGIIINDFYKLPWALSNISIGITQ